MNDETSRVPETALVTRKRLEQALRSARGPGSVDDHLVNRMWAALTEPPYQDDRVYVDVNGAYWYRLAAMGPWRHCRTGATADEGVPAGPLRLMGPLPTRDEVRAAVELSADGRTVLGGKAIVYQIMALLGQTDGDDHA